jgi:hypothetical protein
MATGRRHLVRVANGKEPLQGAEAENALSVWRIITYPSVPAPARLRRPSPPTDFRHRHAQQEALSSAVSFFVTERTEATNQDGEEGFGHG